MMVGHCDTLGQFVTRIIPLTKGATEIAVVICRDGKYSSHQFGMDASGMIIASDLMRRFSKMEEEA